MMTDNIIPQYPDFFELLNTQDKKHYLYMKLTLSSSVCKNRRNQSDKTFKQILDMIKTFCIRNNDDDWKRCIVCGIFWLEDNKIAVNSKQLCVLLSKCKSSINGSLQNLHYSKLKNNRDIVKAFLTRIPLYINHPDLIVIRQWTIRQYELHDESSEQNEEAVQNVTEEPNDIFDHVCEDKSIPHSENDFSNPFMNFDSHNYFYFSHDLFKDDFHDDNDAFSEHHYL